jgi:hypothetical protein
VTAEEIPRVAIQFAAAQARRCYVHIAHREPPDPVKVMAPLRDQRHGLLVFDQSVRALRFQRSEIERDEQRFSRAAQVLVSSLGHTNLLWNSSHPPLFLDALEQHRQCLFNQRKHIYQIPGSRR